jgi:hypothetical protein
LVLLALLSAAVFAQDNGSGWKIGFKAQLVRDFFYTTKATGEGEVTTKTNPALTTDATNTMKLGDYIKGSSNLFTFTNREGFDQRIQVSLSNNGDHHSVYIDMKTDDNWADGPWSSLSFNDILTGSAADWHFIGDTGGLEGSFVVLDGKVGTGRYGGFVPVYEIWDDYIGAASENFFGVRKTDGFYISNNISATSMTVDTPWHPVFAIGATFADNFRFALGSTFGSFNSGDDNPVASASYTEAGFMFSGRGIAELLSFDLFYAIKGEDLNTVKRGTGEWQNIIGVYAGLDLDKTVKGLGVSVGYTANFTQNETAEINVSTTTAVPSYKTYETTNPVWSGIDINVKFSGIEKVGIGFNNNLSFAGVKGEDKKKPEDALIVGLGGTALGKDYNENWFAYRARLAFSYAITGRLGVTLALNNVLTVFDTDTKIEAAGVTTTIVTKSTTDNLITSLHADYNAGNVTFGIGFTLGLESMTEEGEVDSKAAGGGATVTYKFNLNNVRFGVPLFFRVSF